MFVLRQIGQGFAHQTMVAPMRGRGMLVSAFALALSVSVLGCDIALAEDLADPVPLRGAIETQHPSDALHGPYDDAQGPTLRGSHDPSYAPSYDSGPETPSLMSELAGTIAHSMAGFAPLTQVPDQLRGSGGIVRDRDQRLIVPDRPSLRQAMLFGDLRPSDNAASGRLGDAVALALRGSYTTRGLLERAKADRARVRAAAGGFLPKLTLSTDLSSEHTEADADYTDTMTGDVQLSIPIYSSGAVRNALYQAQSLSLASDYSYLAGEHRVALEAIAAHVNLRLNRAIERALRKNEKAMKRLLAIAQRRYQAGDATRTDIAIARGNLEGARAELDIARKSREEVATDYASVVGNRAPSHLAPAHADRMVPNTAEEAVAMARRYNPILISAHHAADASGYAARAEKGRFGPKVDFYGTYSQELYTSSTTSTDPETTFGIRLKVPLVDFAAMPSVKAAKHDALEAGYRALDQERLIIKQIKRKHIAYKSALHRTRISDRQVKAIERSVVGTRREYEAGFRSITDVTNGQIKLTRAMITKITAQHERMLCGYELAFATGNPEIARLVLEQ
ncbi:MAG: TolC family protein [Pseudomonadota bacterium]